MSEHHTPPGREGDRTGPVIRDKRRIDPTSGEARPAPDGPSGAGPTEAQAATGDPAQGSTGDTPQDAAGDLADAQQQASERLEDLQRLQAEYVNYRRRVERDRSLARENALIEVFEAFIPVMDDVELARQHGELEGPFAAVADKVEAVLGRFGWQRYGEVGEVFDPAAHEALMHSHSVEVDGPSVVQVLQPGYRVGDRIVRAARVAVAEPPG